MKQLTAVKGEREELAEQLAASVRDTAELVRQLAAAKRKVTMGTWC